MSVTPDPGLVRVLRALSNPVRLQLLQWLREPTRHFAPEDVVEVGVCVSHIQAKAGLAQSTVSAYLAELERVGLVRATRLRAHLDAGADHVAVQVIGVRPGKSAMPYWRLLADAVRPPRAAVSSVAPGPGRGTA